MAALSAGSARADQLSTDPPCAKECVAAVEQVFKAEDAGFEGVAYQVTWRGQKVIVEDPIRSTNLSVGEKVHFLVFKHDMTTRKDGKKLLSFMVSGAK